MTIREDIQAKFNTAAEAARRPFGLTPENGTDPRFVSINANFLAVQESLLLLADEIDRIKAQS